MQKANWRMSHMPKGVPEFVGDSPVGLQRAVRKKAKTADFNALPTKDDDIANAHYVKFLRFRFKPTDGNTYPKSMGIDDFDMKDLHRNFEARWMGKTYKIGSMLTRVRQAKVVGVITELEPKRTITHDVAMRFTSRLEGHGIDPHHWIIVKCLWGRPGTPLDDLMVWKDLGYRVLMSFHRPFVTLPKEYEDKIDFYRGFKPRFK